MLIELKKVKLTKSIVNQMVIASPTTFMECECLGYLVNCVKEMPKAFLLTKEGKYLVFPANWSKGEKSIYRRIGKWSQSREFNSIEECSKFWRVYSIRLIEVEQIYL